MRYRLICCDVLYREMCACVARSPHMVDMEFLPKGLHDIGSTGMRSRLQERIDATDAERYDAVLMGYGLCNNGLHGLRARGIPLVLPRAHDCMTLFFGSRQAYTDYFNNNPGVYFKTTGWIERGDVTGELSQQSISHQYGMDQTYEQLVEQYGEENAQYLWETLCNQTKNYGKFTFIEMGVEPDARFEDQARQEAEQRGWAFEKVRGDLGLVDRLVRGDWDEADFLVVQPGWESVARYDEGILASRPVPEGEETP